FILELNGGMAVVAVLAVVLMAMTRSGLQGIDTTLLFGCVGFGAFVVAPTVWFSSWVAPYWIQVLALLYEASLTLAAFAIGPRLSSTVVAFYVIQGVCVVTLATRRAAAIHLTAMGVGYALLLAFQDGNNAPVSRWLLGMGAVLFAGSAVS